MKRFAPAAVLLCVLLVSVRLAADDPAPAKDADRPTPTATSTPADEDPPTPEDAAPAKDAPPADAAESKSETPTPTKPSAGAKRYELKYKFIPGEVIRSEVVHRATVQTTIQNTSQTADTSSKSTKCWRVRDVTTDGNVVFEHMVEKIDMWQRTQGHKEIRYNSEAGGDIPPGYEDVAKAVGVTLTIVTMDQHGKILKRQERRSQPMSLSTQMTMPLADHPVAVGDSWSSPMDIDVILKDSSVKKVQTRQKFTLESVTDDVATITIDTQILTPIHDPAIEAQLIQRLSAGTARFDISSGRILSQQLDLDRRVIGFSGPSSSMHYLTRFTEELLPTAPETARHAAPATPAPSKTVQPANAAAKSPPAAKR